MLGEPLAAGGQARAEQPSVTPFDAFQAAFQGQFPDARLSAIPTPRVEGQQEVLTITPPEAADLLRLGVYAADVKAREEHGKPSSGIGFFNVIPVGETLSDALRVWQETHPREGLPQGAEYHILVFRDASDAQGYWEGANAMLERYAGEVGNVVHEAAYSRILHELAPRNPAPSVPLSIDSQQAA